MKSANKRNRAGNGLALVFNGISIRPIFVLGDEAEVRELLKALPIESGYLNLRDHHLTAAAGIYQYQESHRMQRMVVEDFNARPHTETVALSPEHASEIEQLYATGDGGGVAFGAFQVASRFFRGIRRDGELIAVAGVHVVSRHESVAGVGNVFTRADCRGRGLAQIATSAVVAALLEAGIATIGLNVEHTNAPAIAAYHRLGFRTAFEYWEGPATRLANSTE